MGVDVATPGLLVTVVLDETGSMSDTADDTREAMNKYIAKLAKETPHARVSLTKFSKRSGNSQEFRVLVAGAEAKDVPKLTRENYAPDGYTPLYDAIGKAIRETEQIQAGRYLLVILTDGVENASKEWTQQGVRELIEEKQASGNWTIVYLGANQDAWGVAERLGVPQGSAMVYAQTSGGVTATMDSLARATTSYASSTVSSTNTFFSDAGQTEADYEDPDLTISEPEK